ncbi:MAG TPA: GGDEF domain-containing protein, partial [Burkholderiaceae bacterium]|nr:GGDEF domain-containing protein [Burkholderiaceae bacterium]
MEATRPAALTGAATDNAQLAKAALRRLALDKLDPTPENYARAWRQEAGETQPPVADGPAIATLIGRIVRGIERGSKGWTAARKKDSLQRVLDGSRSDARRLQQRLSQLVASWDSEAAPAVEACEDDPATIFEPMPTSAALLEALAPLPWGRAVNALGVGLQAALPQQGEAPHEITLALATLIERIEHEGATPALIDELEALCRRTVPVLQHRHHLLDQLGSLCVELTASLTDLAENDSWAKGQCEAMQVKIDEGLSARGIRAVSELLRDTRARQGRLREERERARDSLKGLINRMLSELDQLGSQTGNFHDSVGRYADVIEKADSLESLAGAVREMVEESRSVQALVQQTQARLQAEHSKATGLTQRVSELEDEMRRLSDEVSTDQLTKIANRRGLMQAFEAERARLQRDGGQLSIGLLDIDNFKRLNDDLGHTAGDEALKALATLVDHTLRPSDHVARYGG